MKCLYCIVITWFYCLATLDVSQAHWLFLLRKSCLIFLYLSSKFRLYHRNWKCYVAEMLFLFDKARNWLGLALSVLGSTSTASSSLLFLNGVVGFSLYMYVLQDSARSQVWGCMLVLLALLQLEAGELSLGKHRPNRMTVWKKKKKTFTGEDVIWMGTHRVPFISSKWQLACRICWSWFCPSIFK